MFFRLLVVVCTLMFLYWIKARRRTPPLPPGPPADPLIGHLLKIPSESQGDLFYQWGKIYGDVMYLHVLGRPIVVFNSAQAAVDLLDKRSANYSDRPRFTVFELMGWDRTLVFIPYGKLFRKHRRYLQQYLAKTVIAVHHPVQSRESRLLLQKLSSAEVDWSKHLERFATAIILRIAYGHEISSDDDPYISLTRDVSYAISNAGPPGSTPVDFFPFLGYLPAWFPGAFYGGFARDNKFAVNNMRKYPYERVRKEMAAGKALPSFMSHQLEALDRDEFSEHDDILNVQAAAAAMYSAGAETTSSILSHFVLVMVLFPEFQEMAQKEIDTVIGSGRLPEFSDRDSLPFVECVFQEILRWHGSVPTGVPHRSLKDDVYKGMFIPGGSLVMANTRSYQ